MPGTASEALRLLNDTRNQAEEAMGALGGVAGGMLGQKPPGPAK